MTQTGIVNIRGKQYETVALRVQKFREKHPDYRLLTEIIERTDAVVVMRASIWNGDMLIATGHAEEYRKASEINKTSALENCETSAIGRALAALGLGGTEFASADEVARAVSGAKGSPVISPVKTALAELSDESMAHVQNVADAIIEAVANGDDRAVFELSESLDSDQRVYLWDMWKEDSRLRAKVKSIVSTMRQVAAQAEKVAA